MVVRTPLRPVFLGLVGLVVVSPLVVCWLKPWPGAAPVESAVIDDESVTALRPSTGSIPVARVTAVNPRPMPNAVLERLLADLRRILHSPIQDNVWPPSDLRDVIAALAGHPEETLSVLTETLHALTSSRMARTRPIWAMWLVGDATPRLVPNIAGELAAVLRSTDQGELWQDIADVLHQLGIPETSLRGVAEAVQSNPAAAHAKGLFNPEIAWEAALTLEEMGPSAAEALPARREALVLPNQRHIHYLANAIKAIDPTSPKPIFERDDLLPTLRKLSDEAAELSRVLDQTQRGAAAAEGSRRDKRVCSRLGTSPRRAERGDFVAKWGDASGIGGRKVRRQKPRSTR